MTTHPSDTPVGNHVAIIGAGALGLVTLKNLKEQGLQVTSFEQNEFIGGLWHVTPRTDQNTAFPMTKFNTSKQASHFSDFPFPDDASTHPTAKDIDQYLNAFANNFDLIPHIKFSKKVEKIERDEVNKKWILQVVSTGSDRAGQPKERYAFDRLVLATGQLNRPNLIDIKGIEKFEGDAVQSLQFKDPFKYTGKNVLIIGVGSTGADVQSFLKSAKARSVYMSHRGQYYLLPKMVEGKAFDHSVSRRGMSIIRGLGDWWPKATEMVFTKALDSTRQKTYPWLKQHPSFLAPRVLQSAAHRLPVFSADLAENLRDGITKSAHGVSEVTGPRSVKFTDGTVLDDIDAIIICTGYHYDFSLLKDAGDPTDPTKAPDRYERINAAVHKDPHVSFPRLYRGFISEQYPESLAIIGHTLLPKTTFSLNDLITMALASIWSGAAPLPSRADIARDIDSHYDTVVDVLSRGPMPHMGFRMFGSATYTWLNKVAGTGVTDRLASFSMEAWKLWWNDRKFYNLLMDGVDDPAVYRLFDTGRGRKVWPGAREQILKTNIEVKEMGERWKKENSSKSK